MAYANPKAVVRTWPEKGCFYYELETSIPAGTYPIDGDGFGGTSGDALWTSLGLSDGDFEVEITYMEVGAGSVVSLTNRFSSNVVSFAAGKGEPGIRMKNGFTADTTSGSLGGVIGFRIHAYKL